MSRAAAKYGWSSSEWQPVQRCLVISTRLEDCAGVTAGRFGPLLCRNSQIHRGKRDLLRRLSLFLRGKSNLHWWSSEIPRRKSDFRRWIRKSSAGEHFSTTEFDKSHAGEAIPLAGRHGWWCLSSGGKSDSSYPAHPIKREHQPLFLLK